MKNRRDEIKARVDALLRRLQARYARQFDLQNECDDLLDSFDLSAIVYALYALADERQRQACESIHNCEGAPGALLAEFDDATRARDALLACVLNVVQCDDELAALREQERRASNERSDEFTRRLLRPSDN